MFLIILFDQHRKGCRLQRSPESGTIPDNLGALRSASSGTVKRARLSPLKRACTLILATHTPAARPSALLEGGLMLQQCRYNWNSVVC